MSLRVFVPEGMNDRSPTPQGLRRDRDGWSVQREDFECAVVREGRPGSLRPGTVSDAFRPVRTVRFGCAGLDIPVRAAPEPPESNRLYETDSLFYPFLAVNCQATIIQSLRDENTPAPFD
jgi:hypothetical protein